MPREKPTEEEEVNNIVWAAEARYRWASERAVEEVELKPIVDVVKAILKVLTPEQREQVLEKVKLQ